MPLIAGKKSKSGTTRKPSAYNMFIKKEMDKANVKGQDRATVRAAFKNAVSKYNSCK